MSDSHRVSMTSAPLIISKISESHFIDSTDQTIHTYSITTQGPGQIGDQEDQKTTASTGNSATLSKEDFAKQPHRSDVCLTYNPATHTFRDIHILQPKLIIDRLSFTKDHLMG